MWEVLATSFEGQHWMPAVKLAETGGRNDVRSAGVVDPAGRLWFAWSADSRTWAHNVPFTTEVAYTRLQPARAADAPRLTAFHEPPLQSTPVHADEPANVAAIRAYRYQTGARQYRILRGDLHRHTD